MFEEMIIKQIKLGKPCHGLVISGHYTGAFGGKRLSNEDNELSILDIERLRCNRAYKSFFDQIEAVWLNGCRTGYLPFMDNDPAKSADEYVQQLLIRHRADLIHTGFSYDLVENLFTGNSAIDRAQTIFPNAIKFGWGGTAPGEKSGSERNLIDFFTKTQKKFGFEYLLANLRAFNEGNNRLSCVIPFAENSWMKLSPNNSVSLMPDTKYLDRTNSSCLLEEFGNKCKETDSYVIQWKKVKAGNKLSDIFKFIKNLRCKNKESIQMLFNEISADLEFKSELYKYLDDDRQLSYLRADLLNFLKIHSIYKFDYESKIFFSLLTNVKKVYELKKNNKNKDNNYLVHYSKFKLVRAMHDMVNLLTESVDDQIIKTSHLKSLRGSCIFLGLSACRSILSHLDKVNAEQLLAEEIRAFPKDRPITD
jgi:hypothetical protein